MMAKVLHHLAILSKHIRMVQSFRQGKHICLIHLEKFSFCQLEKKQNNARRFSFFLINLIRQPATNSLFKSQTVSDCSKFIDSKIQLVHALVSASQQLVFFLSFPFFSFFFLCASLSSFSCLDFSLKMFLFSSISFSIFGDHHEFSVEKEHLTDSKSSVQEPTSTSFTVRFIYTVFSFAREYQDLSFIFSVYRIILHLQQ